MHFRTLVSEWTDIGLNIVTSVDVAGKMMNIGLPSADGAHDFRSEPDSTANRQ